MTTGLKSKDPLAFLRRYSVDDIKVALTEAVAALAQEYDQLHKAERDPQPAPERLKEVLEKPDLTTADLARMRVESWENTQDQLWEYYRYLNGQATESGATGGSPVGEGNGGS